jgi:hypothetical protein
MEPKPKKPHQYKILDQAIHETAQLLVDIMRRRGKNGK